MSDTLRQAIANAVLDNYNPTEGSTRRITDVVLAAVLADPTIRRWKAAEETAAYFISQYPTIQLAEEREWDPALDALAKAVTPTAGVAGETT